jgi:DMSO reductase family type II enzyme heme b subunit
MAQQQRGGSNMRARYVAGLDLDKLLDPEAGHWSKARSERLSLVETPIDLQPTASVRVTWLGKKYGAVDRVSVAAVHNGSTLAFRLEWKDASENRTLDDITTFQDAAAVLLPSVPGAPVITMGMPGMEVNAWYWSADEDDAGRHVVAEGVGTSRAVGEKLVRGRGLWKGGRWRVVISRALQVQTSEPVAQLKPGGTSQFAVAVWEGQHGERAGIKSYSAEWRELQIEAA